MIDSPDYTTCDIKRTWYLLSQTLWDKTDNIIKRNIWLYTSFIRDDLNEEEIYLKLRSENHIHGIKKPKLQ